MITVEQRPERDLMQQVFDKADLVARFRQTLTSPHGNRFRLRQLQTPRRERSRSKLERLRKEVDETRSDAGILFYQNPGAPENGEGRYDRCRVGFAGAVSVLSTPDRGFPMADLPGVITLGVDSITGTSATFRGELTSLGTPPPMAHGFCIGASKNPIMDEEGVDCYDLGGVSLLGVFSVPVDSLTAGTQYHVRAFAQNVDGIEYGGDLIFRTVPSPYSSVVAGDGEYADMVRVTWDTMDAVDTHRDTSMVKCAA